MGTAARPLRRRLVINQAPSIQAPSILFSLGKAKLPSLGDFEHPGTCPIPTAHKPNA
jgi:hypothetical protein